MATSNVSGGCQCGKIRYRVNGAFGKAYLCHCRMCQKAAGNYFMPLAHAPRDSFQATRGEIAWFFSSARVRRGFCRDCGTPLIYDNLDERHLNLSLGSLDDPSVVKPRQHVGVEGRLPWFDDLYALESLTSQGDMPTDQLAVIAESNRQHPDHDTDHWP